MSGSRPNEVLGVIAARGGSKGLPGKNVRLLGGRPLIQHAVRAARESRALTDFLVSTDDEAIAGAARAAGAPVPFLRPAALATDAASIWPVVRHAAESWEKEKGRKAAVVVLLQAASPLRTGADIDACVERLERDGAEVCVTAARSHDSPYFNMLEMAPEAAPFARPCTALMKDNPRRQEAPAVYALNGAVYALRRAVLDGLENPFRSARLSVSEMPRSRSVDIDTEEDFALAEFWLARGAR